MGLLDIRGEPCTKDLCSLRLNVFWGFIDTQRSRHPVVAKHTGRDLFEDVPRCQEAQDARYMFGQRDVRTEAKGSVT